MRIYIYKRFVGEGGRMWADGERDIDPKTGAELIAQGRAEEIEVEAPASVGIAARVAATLPTAVTVSDDDENAAQAIPEDFPERDLLIAGGVTTLDQLLDPEAELDLIEGIGPARLAKIEAAISILRGDTDDETGDNDSDDVENTSGDEV